MIRHSDDPEAIARRGRDIYEQNLKHLLEPYHDGEFVVLNVETGEYEVGGDDVEVSRRAKTRFPDATLLTLRVGRAAAFRIGTMPHDGQRKLRFSRC